MIIYIDTTNIDFGFISQYEKQMPINRRAEYQQMIKDEDKVNCIVAFLIVKYYYLNAGYNDISICYSTHGKPYVENNPISFSISHSKGIVAVGFDTDNEIGIDIEKIEDIDNDIINILYSDTEKEKYSEILNEPKIFYKAWVMKESYAKRLGLGLYFNFNSLSLDLDKNTTEINEEYIHSYILEKYCLAIATKRTNIEIRKIKLDDLTGRK